jgi:hypothetical protein
MIVPSDNPHVLGFEPSAAVNVGSAFVVIVDVVLVAQTPAVGVNV